MAWVTMPERQEDAGDHLRFLLCALQARLRPEIWAEHKKMVLTEDAEGGLLGRLSSLICACGWRLTPQPGVPVVQIREDVHRHADEANAAFLGPQLDPETPIANEERWSREDD